MIKKTTALTLCMLMLLSSFICVAAEQKEINIAVTIAEQNNIRVGNNLYRRGVAFAEGEVTDLSNLGLYDKDGVYIPSMFEVSETYRDGSVKWMLLSFVTELRPSEIKEMYIKNTGSGQISHPVSATVGSAGVELSNEHLTVKADSSGITQIQNAANCISNINMYLTLAGQDENLLSIFDFKIIKQNDLYVKASAGGLFTGNHVGEIVMTLAAGAKTLDIETRFTSKADINIYSMGLEITPAGGHSIRYPQTSYGSDYVVGSDYITLSNNSQTAVLATRDVEKFRGATNDKNLTGFELTGKSVRLAPIVNQKNYAWADGMTRTNHLTVTFEPDGTQQVETLKNPVVVTVDTAQYVKAGVIANDDVNAPLDVFMGTVECDYTRRDGKIDAGALHYSVDPNTGTVGTGADRHPGEMEYNYGMAYMASGNNLLYNAMCESAEFWADIYIYKGDLEEVYGANRYRLSFTEYQSRTSHPYYGDSSGLYMTYMLSGNEYLLDIYKIAIEHIYKNMYTSKNMGHNYPHMYQWHQENPIRLTYVESRYMIQARPLYLAYNLFGNEKYKEAALEIARWAESAQTEDGYWYQAMLDNGSPLIQGGQTNPAVKIYIWMFGLRGVSFLSRYESSPEITKVLTKAADFICTELDNYGPGLWHPTGNADVYEFAEDGSRGKARHEDIMAIEILYSAYRLTHNEKHLEAMLKSMKTWLSSMNPDGTCILTLGNYGVTAGYGAGGTTNYTLFTIAREVTNLFKEESDLVKKLGYGYMLDVFDANAKMYDKTVEKPGITEPEVMQCIYENGDKKVLFASKILAYSEDEIHKDYTTIIPEAGLWQGMENRISNPVEVTLYKNMDLFEEVVAQWRPIYVTSMTSNVSAFVDSYSEKEIVFRVYGDGQVDFNIQSGDFVIEPNRKYSVRMKRDGSNGIVVTVCRDCLGNVKSGSNGLRFQTVIGNVSTLKDTESTAALFSVQSGLMSLTSDSAFLPDDVADLQEFSRGVSRITGTNSTFYGTTYQEAASYVLPLMIQKQATMFEKQGISRVDFTAVGNVSDEEAVQLGADYLEIPETSCLGGDITLPAVSLAGTKVSWQSKTPEIITDSGVFLPEGLPCEEVVMTATVTKGSASCRRDFTFKVRPITEVEWNADSTIPTENAHKLKAQSGQFTIDYVVTLNSAPTNALVAFSDASLAADSFAMLPMIIRFSPEGRIDAYNNNDYAHVDELAYSAGVTYHVSLSVDTSAGVYSVSVKPSNENKTYTIAKNYKFRATASAPGKIDVMYLPTATSGQKLYTVTSVDCAEYEKDKTLTQTIYGDYGLLFGQYAYGNVSLPTVIGEHAVSWISNAPDVVDGSGKILLNNGIQPVFLYSSEQDGNTASDSVSVLYKLHMIESTEGKDERLTRKQSAELLRALQYCYE